MVHLDDNNHCSNSITLFTYQYFNSSIPIIIIAQRILSLTTSICLIPLICWSQFLCSSSNVLDNECRIATFQAFTLSAVELGV